MKLIFSLAVGFSFHWSAVVGRGGSIVVLNYVGVSVGWLVINIRVERGRAHIGRVLCSQTSFSFEGKNNVPLLTVFV